jgi:hypothetical protein
MRIAAYTDDVQKRLGTKTKPAPYLHIAMGRFRGSTIFAIYIWDTREVVEEGTTDKDLLGVKVSGVNDSKQALKGGSLSNMLTKQMQNPKANK